MVGEQLHTGEREMESVEASLRQPSYENLLAWWKEEMEFIETPIGRQWYAMRLLVRRLQMEHETYQKAILDYTESSAEWNPLKPR